MAGRGEGGVGGPQLHIAVSEDEGEVVPGHVVRLARDEENPGVSRGFEVQREVEVAVGVLQGRQAEVRAARELRSSAELESLLALSSGPAEGTQANLLSPLQDPTQPRPAVQPAESVQTVNVVGERNVRQSPGRLELLVFQFRYRNFVMVQPGVRTGPSLRVSECELDVSWLEELGLLFSLSLADPGSPGSRVVNMPGRQAQLLQLLSAQFLSFRLLRWLNVHLDLDGNVGQRLLLLLRLGTVES